MAERAIAERESAVAATTSESRLETANQLLEWHRGLLDELRQLCFDTDADPKPQWNVARDMNRLLTIGQKIDAARAGAKAPAPTHAALVAQLEVAEERRVQAVATCAELRGSTRSLERQLDDSIERFRAQHSRAEAAEAQVAELTRERDEARDIARRVPGLEFDLKAKAHECEIADAEVTRLTEALAAAERQLEAQPATAPDMVELEPGWSTALPPSDYWIRSVLPATAPARTETSPGEAFAKYHDEHAAYGGVSWEFHARAATFCRTAMARTEAEQAVLKALADVPETWLRWFCKSAGCWNVVEFKAVGDAELARRESKKDHNV